MNRFSLLEQLATLIERVPPLSHVSLASDDERDAALDTRDADPFDAAWIAHHAALQPLETMHPLQPEERAAIDRIRERTFKAAYRASLSSDLAGYVSDDFDLLARALCYGYESPWLSALLSSYAQGHFPTGDLSPHPSPLAALLQERTR